MARPKLAIPFVRVLEAYHVAGSLRGAAKLLECSRYAVQRRLQENGVQAKDRDEAMATVRLLRDERLPYRAYRTTEEIEWIGSPEAGGTRIVRTTFTPYLECIWPGCVEERKRAVLCEGHAVATSALSANGDCAWPMCPNTVCSEDALCTYHRGKVEGRLQ